MVSSHRTFSSSVNWLKMSKRALESSCSAWLQMRKSKEMIYLDVPEELGLLMQVVWRWQCPVSQTCVYWSLDGTFGVQLISLSCLEIL